MKDSDKNVVKNIRYDHGKIVEQYTDDHIAETWRHFSQNEDYPDKEKFLEWLKD